jgi:nucleoside 2-deoxyribosyltransferase
MNPSRLCLIGQVFIDFVESNRSEPMMRLGGIMHAARALWAMKMPFGFAYIAPEYLKADAEKFASGYGASDIRQIGTISRCPNVVVVGEGKEVGNQRYDYILRELSDCELKLAALEEMICASTFTDFLLFPGNFPLRPVLELIGRTKADVFADINFVDHGLSELSALGRKFSSLILSTSSDLFLNNLDGDPLRLTPHFGRFTDTVLLKENRGGSRLFQSGSSDWIGVPAQPCPVMHSVGVGDVFDTVFVTQQRLHEVRAALAYASFVAAEYASHFEPSELRDSMAAVFEIPPNDIQHFAGVFLPWEVRKKINIYLAAPDFDYVNTTPITTLYDALVYHNFSPRRPIKENGQASANSTATEKRRLAEADLSLLAECNLLIAVLLYDDPGTLIEVGIALERKIPVIVFDPYARADNLMLTTLPDFVSRDLDSVIVEVFKQAARINDGHS